MFYRQVRLLGHSNILTGRTSCLCCDPCPVGNMPHKHYSLTLSLSLSFLHKHAHTCTHTMENHLQNISHILCCDFIMSVIQAGKLLPCAVSKVKNKTKTTLILGRQHLEIQLAVAWDSVESSSAASSLPVFAPACALFRLLSLSL